MNIFTLIARLGIFHLAHEARPRLPFFRSRLVCVALAFGGLGRAALSLRRRLPPRAHTCAAALFIRRPGTEGPLENPEGEPGSLLVGCGAAASAALGKCPRGRLRRGDV